MMTSKCVYLGLLMVHCSYPAARTIKEPHMIIQMISPTVKGPKFVYIDGAYVKKTAQTNSMSTGGSSRENRVFTNSVKEADATVLKQNDDSMYLPSEDLSIYDSPILPSTLELLRFVRGAQKTTDYDEECSNTVADWLGSEYHIPCYQYCGSGTNYKDRVQQGKKGINALDAACREHDKVYDATTDTYQRLKADKVLIAAAKKIYESEETSYTEYLMAGAVIGAMSSKILSIHTMSSFVDHVYTFFS